MTLEFKVLVIAGPTATGKSQSALRLAQELHGEIVNADSVQVYRGFDIGSAKPSVAEQALAPHHLIDILNPDEFIDAARFAAFADQAIAEISSRKKLPIVVGGTGLWLRALLRGLVDVPAANSEIRSRLEGEIESEGAPALHMRLQKVDPSASQRIHPNDALRIVRALEVYEQTGKALGAMQDEHRLGTPRYSSIFVVIEASKEILDPRIEERVDQMLNKGWLDEAKALYERWGPNVRAFGSVGYRQLREHLEGQCDFGVARQEILKVTRTYARRQRTWFASEPGVDWRMQPATLLAPNTLERIQSWRTHA